MLLSILYSIIGTAVLGLTARFLFVQGRAAGWRECRLKTGELLRAAISEQDVFYMEGEISQHSTFERKMALSGAAVSVSLKARMPSGKRKTQS